MSIGIWLLQEEYDGIPDDPEVFMTKEEAHAKSLERINDYHNTNFEREKEAYDYMAEHWGDGDWGR